MLKLFIDCIGNLIYIFKELLKCSWDASNLHARVIADMVERDADLLWNTAGFVDRTKR